MKFLYTYVFFLLTIQLQAQIAKDSPLFQTVKKQDSLLFARGFNQCDMAYLESVTHKDLQAYYERGEAQNRLKFFEDVQKYYCDDADNAPIPKVDPDNLEIFTLENRGIMNGVVRSGSLNFYRHEPGKPDVLTSTAKFVHVWLLENGKWLLKEVMRFDHQLVK